MIDEVLPIFPFTIFDYYFRYALVSGANRGIGLEICRQLASKGIVVILAARDEKRGIEARESLKEFGNVFFHQLDVADADSVAAVADFVRNQFGRLDILVYMEFGNPS